MSGEFTIFSVCFYGWGAGMRKPVPIVYGSGVLYEEFSDLFLPRTSETTSGALAQKTVKFSAPNLRIIGSRVVAGE
jgi:hypothetical protein